MSRQIYAALVQLGVEQPQLRPNIRPILAKLAPTPRRKEAHQKRFADTRDRLGPGINGQQELFLLDIVADTYFPEAKSQGYTASVSNKTSKATLAFANACKEALTEYVLNRKNLDNVRWERLYNAKGSPWKSETVETPWDQGGEEYELRQRNRLWDGEEDISEEFPPRAPKPVVQEGKLDKAAISWAKEAIDTMGSYTYEILLAFLGADPSYDSLDVIIKDSHKAARSLKQTLGSMFSKWEDAVMSDMRDNLEEEAARKFEQVGRDAHSDFMEEMHDIERHRMYLSLPANIDNALKDITRKLKTIRTYTPQTLAPFVRELNALLKMCNPRKQERRLQDICGDIENAASSLLVSFEEIVDGVDF